MPTRRAWRSWMPRPPRIRRANSTSSWARSITASAIIRTPSTAINRGIQKGQIKHQDEAYVYLGRAQVALKNTAEAKKAFAGLKSVPNISPRVLKLWELYADTLGR